MRDFCRTLRNAGCGYYPNSTFVHMDVRDTKAYWVDLSRPGEPPRYEKPGALADEGISDVPLENAEPQPGGAPEIPEPTAPHEPPPTPGQPSAASPANGGAAPSAAEDARTPSGN